MTQLRRWSLVIGWPLVVSLFVPGSGLASRQRGETRATALFVAASTTGSGIRIGPAQRLVPRADVLEAIRTSAEAAKVDLTVTIYPDRADCILSLELDEVRSGANQFWTLIDADSGAILDSGRRGSLRVAVHEAVKAVGQHCGPR